MANFTNSGFRMDEPKYDPGLDQIGCAVGNRVDEAPIIAQVSNMRGEIERMDETIKMLYQRLNVVIRQETMTEPDVENPQPIGGSSLFIQLSELNNKLNTQVREINILMSQLEV